MSDPDLSILTRRIERLERVNRRLRLMGMLGAVVLGAVALMGQAQPPRVSKVVEAEQFLLKDVTGKLRGQWIVQDNGFVALQFISSAQQRRMMLFNATDDSVGLVISNRPGNTVVDLTADAKGDQAGLRLYDYDARRATKPRAAIEARDGVPVVSLFDGHGRAHAMLTLRAQPMKGGSVTSANGRYVLPYLGYGRYTVTPTKDGCTFTPETWTGTLTKRLTLAPFRGSCP